MVAEPTNRPELRYGPATIPKLLTNPAARNRAIAVDKTLRAEEFLSMVRDSCCSEIRASPRFAASLSD
jgi:hypothetical protein